MSQLLDSKDALTLPDGIIRDAELKKIPDIFSEENLLTAAEIIIAVNDSDLVFFKADVLERAYSYGWLEGDIVENASGELGTVNQHDRKEGNFLGKLLDSNLVYVLLSVFFSMYLFGIPLGCAYAIVQLDTSRESMELTHAEKSDDFIRWSLALLMLFASVNAGVLMLLDLDESG